MLRFRYVLPICLFLLSSFSAFAQNVSFTLLDFDIRDYPQLRAHFFLSDAAGNPIRDLFATDFTLRHNDVDYVPRSLSCPSPAPPERLSSVLAVDISGSMLNLGNIDIARGAAAAWIDALPLGYSECALTSFDHEGYLNSDFTTDRQLLKQKISALEPNHGGTEYSAGLLADPVGAVRVAATGAHKRVVVFLTDGDGGGNEEAIVGAARDKNVTVYVVVLRMPAPPVLKGVAERTGGLWFDDVESVEQAMGIYRAILRRAQGEEPCELLWEVQPDCTPRHELEIEIPFHGVKWTGAYSLPDTVFPSLTFSPFGVAFGLIPPGTAKDTVITLIARNRPVSIRRIESESPFFTLLSGAENLPIILKPGERRELTIRFSPTDSAFRYGKIVVESDACFGSAIGCTGGLPGLRSPETLLRLRSPNGGEVFNVGGEVLIEWEGVLPEDTVMLEYSIDGGTAWTLITDDATGLRHRWVAPPTPSNRCLMRVRQRTAGGETGVLTIPAETRLSTGDFSPDGRFVAIGEYAVAVHDAFTGERLSAIDPLPRPAHSLHFSPDGSALLVGSGDIVTYLLDWLNAQVIRMYGGVPMLSASRFSPDGTRIAAHSYDGDGAIYDVGTGQELQRLRGHTLRGFAVAYSPDGTRIVTGGTDNRAIIWDAETGALLHTLPHNNWVNSAFFSPDGGRVVTACSDSSVMVWDAFSGDLLMKIPQPVAASSAQYSPDGKQLCITRYGSVVELRDAETGMLLRELVGHRRSVLFADWSNDGGRILTVGWDSTARIWDLSRLPNQIDSSDRYWAIVQPMLGLRDVLMPRTAVGASYDSVVVDWICNTGTAPIRIDSITFADGQHFSLVSRFRSVVLLPGECIPVEFRFSPDRFNFFSDSVIVHSGEFVTAAIIQGQGMLDPLGLGVKSIDFGQVMIGAIKDTVMTAVIRNTGMIPLGIMRTELAGPDREQFSIVSGAGPFTLMPGESQTMEFRFAPIRKGRTSGSVMIEYEIATNFGLGLPPAYLLLYGEGVCPEDLPENTLSIPQTLEAAPGDRLNVPVLLRTSDVPSPSRRYKMLLRYNNSLLAPLDSATLDILTEKERVVMYEGEWTGQEDTLRTLSFIAALGDAESTPLVIESFVWEDGCAGGLTLANGEFRLNGLCPEGGTRLFFGGDPIFLKPIAPNPARDRVRVEYGLLEEGTTELRLLNALGAEVAVLVNASLLPGHYLLDFNTDRIPVGPYYLVLRTPTQVLTERVMIAR